MLALVSHLRKMGETNAQLSRAPALRRDTALAAAAIYSTLFGERDEDGRQGVPASYQARRRR